MRGFLFYYLLRPDPEPVGVSVEPLGEALGPRVFPDGLWVLFGEVTVVPALPVVVPFIVEPVALPVAAEPPAAGLPPAVAPPACASAKVPESANTVANAIVLIFMLVSLVSVQDKSPWVPYVPLFFSTMEAARLLAWVYSRGDNRLLSRVISTYAFPTYGPRGMDFARSEAKIILDHFEGIEPDDVTGRFYSADPAINRKCEIMEK
jgi:hypothetical protein